MSVISTTPSKERIDYETNEAIEKYGRLYGDEFVIINGEGRSNMCKIFDINFLLNKFGINKVGDFYDGTSALYTGCVIKKYDLKKFIKKFNKKRDKLRLVELGPMFMSERIKIFDPAVNEWKVFFELIYGKTQYINKTFDGVYYCRRKATCTVDNFENCRKDMSYYFSADKPKEHWQKIRDF